MELKDLGRFLLSLRNALLEIPTSPNHGEFDNTGYVMSMQLLVRELCVSEYDVFMAALQRDGKFMCDEKLDELYDKYARGGKIPETVGEFCKAVLAGEKPYVRSDGAAVILD